MKTLLQKISQPSYEGCFASGIIILLKRSAKLEIKDDALWKAGDDIIQTDKSF